MNSGPYRTQHIHYTDTQEGISFLQSDSRGLGRRTALGMGAAGKRLRDDIRSQGHHPGNTEDTGSRTIIASGISAVWGATMVNAGVTAFCLITA